RADDPGPLHPRHRRTGFAAGMIPSPYANYETRSIFRMSLLKTKMKIGPRHHGRKMSLRAFEFAPVEEGYIYELARGYIVVSEVANLPHGLCVSFIRSCLGQYYRENPSSLYAIFDSMECKILVPELDSERHPDIAVYLTRPRN